MATITIKATMVGNPFVVGVEQKTNCTLNGLKSLILEKLGMNPSDLSSIKLDYEGIAGSRRRHNRLQIIDEYSFQQAIINRTEILFFVEVLQPNTRFQDLSARINNLASQIEAMGLSLNTVNNRVDELHRMVTDLHKVMMRQSVGSASVGTDGEGMNENTVKVEK